MILILSMVVGFLTGKLLGKDYSGDKFEKNFSFNIGEYYINIHYWILCLFVLIIFLLIGFKNPLFLGFLGGSIIEGILFNNKLVVYNKKDKLKQI